MSELREVFCAWIRVQDIEGCKISEVEGEGFTLASDQMKGWVGFYDIDGQEVVELRLERIEDGESVFFLHFELNDLMRAQELFNEMIAAMQEASAKETTHILLCCTCGMTTTFFAMKLNELAKGLGIDYDFKAVPIDEAKRSGSNYAAVLLAPQVGYQRKELAEALPDTLIIDLPGKIFGSYDAQGALRLVLDATTNTRNVKRDEELRAVREYDDTKCVLALSYIYREDEPTLSYRVLDHGAIKTTGMLVRHPINIEQMDATTILRDMATAMLDDLSVTLRLEGWKMSDFDAVGIAVPGVVDGTTIVTWHNGVETCHEFGEELNKLSEMWGPKVFLHSNACAAAAGCYMTQETYENVAFHAQTVGVPNGEDGFVVEGKSLVGRRGRAGYLAPLAQGYDLEMSPQQASWSFWGIRKLVAGYLSSVICTLAPEVIYVWCDLLPDMDELREELETTLPAASVPELVAIADFDEYALVGELTLTLQNA